VDGIIPDLPSEAAPNPGEVVLGEWSFRLAFHGSPVAEVLARFVLTEERLIVLHLPRPRLAARTGGWLRRSSPATKQFMGDMGRWHVMLNQALKSLPEPVLETVALSQSTALHSRRALTVGSHHYWVGDDPLAEVMAGRVKDQWRSAQRVR